MAGNDEQKRDFPQFDSMSTQALEQLLKSDLERPEQETDVDAILYITEVIMKRKGEEAYKIDPKESWERLEQKRADPEWQGWGQQESAPEGPAGARRRSRRSKRALRGMLIAAAVIAALLLTTVTCYACGFDIWGKVATWTRETFSFVPRDSQPVAQTQSDAPHQPAPQLEQMAEDMAKYGLSGELLPSYLPEGYEVVDSGCVDTETWVEFYTYIFKNDEEILIRLCKHKNVKLSSGIYPKDEVNPEKYTHGGIDYYIMTNVDKSFAAWTSGDLEGQIAGLLDRETLINIINSIGA